MSTSTSADPRERILILGAAGRDFHDFNVLYRDDPSSEVVAFTATQIPDIDGRTYPPALAGPLYPHGIPIVDESGLESLIVRERVDTVVLAYSDLAHTQVMHLASRVVAAGADFVVPGARRTTLRSRRPVVAVTAVRTGVGKSQTTRYVAALLRDMGLRVVAVRHPMPYGDLAAQACQRFETYSDLVTHDCTIEEREEYEPHLDAGVVVYAGVDYGAILREAEAEADVVLWDGGNNDLPFYVPDLHVVLADPLRPGDEAAYHPGEANVRMADLVIVAKCDSATAEDIAAVEASVQVAEPARRGAALRQPGDARRPGSGRRTSGGRRRGRAHADARLDDLRCRRRRARRMPGRPRSSTPHRMPWARSRPPTPSTPTRAASCLPWATAQAQTRDLEATIRAMVDAGVVDVVVSGTPVDLTRVLTVDVPLVRARYSLREQQPGRLEAALRQGPRPLRSRREWRVSRAAGVPRRALKRGRGQLCSADVLERDDLTVRAGQRHPPVGVLVARPGLVDRPPVAHDVGERDGEHAARGQGHPPVQRRDDGVDVMPRHPVPGGHARRTRRAAGRSRPPPARAPPSPGGSAAPGSRGSRRARGAGNPPRAAGRAS